MNYRLEDVESVESSVVQGSEGRNHVKGSTAFLTIEGDRIIILSR